MKPHHDHVAEAMAEIDEALNRPPITIEESLVQAVEAGRMSHEEADQCLQAYLRTLGGVPLDGCEVPTDGF